MTRFDLDMDGSMEPSENGRWVLYEDVQRTWVGLTWDEANEVAIEHDVRPSTVKTIEAKLKEKNT